ncbi:type II methionyl aminopeptidase, partial [Methanococcoides sp. SA1]|nr:type II methionyl aminopeptidase [Methanococcoides sp. SA1]
MDEKIEDIEEIIGKYMQAGEILSTVRSEAKEKVKIGTKLLEVADFVEQRTIELGGLPAFPCNISRND